MATSPIEAATEHFIQYYIQWASIVFVWYDFVLTFNMETKYIWGRERFGWITIPFVFLRYALVGNLLYLFAISHLLPNCNAWYKFIGVLSVFGRASVITILAVRTVGVYHKNRIVIAWLAFLGVTCVILDITHLPGLKCSGSVSIPIVPTLLSVLVCVFELSVMALIAARAAKVYLGDSYQTGGLLHCLLQQGILYFCAVFGFQITAVVLNFVEADPTFQKLINAITLPISCVLVARFTLDLRALDNDAHIQTTKSGPPLSTLIAVSRNRNSNTFVASGDYGDASAFDAGSGSDTAPGAPRSGTRSMTTYQASLDHAGEKDDEASDLKGKGKAKYEGQNIV